jgi:hypothetical protein
VQKPDWIHKIASIAPFAISAGAMGWTTQLPHAAGAAASPEALAAGFATGLLVNGLSALCKLRHFREGKEYQDTLANHDIIRLIHNAWGEAAVATLKAYVEDHRELSITNTPLSENFRKTVASLKPDDFAGTHIGVRTIRDAIKASRQALLSEADVEAALPKHAEEVQDALVASVLDGLTKKLGPAEPIPEDLPDYLAGQRKGVLYHLTIYTAFHLKTDQARANRHPALHLAGRFRRAGAD